MTVFGKPRTFYEAIHSTLGENGTGTRGDGMPTAEDWDAMRKEWPVLAEYTDEELTVAVPELRKNRPDFRSLSRE